MDGDSEAWAGVLVTVGDGPTAGITPIIIGTPDVTGAITMADMVIIHTGIWDTGVIIMAAGPVYSRHNGIRNLNRREPVHFPLETAKTGTIMVTLTEEPPEIQ